MKTKAEGPTLRALTGCGLAEGNSTFPLLKIGKTGVRFPYAPQNNHRKVLK